MRKRTVPRPLALGALMFSGLTACASTAAQSPPGSVTATTVQTATDSQAASSGNGAGTGSNGSGGVGSSDTGTVDIHTVDLGNSEWLYSFGGTDLPVTVKLADGDGDDDAVQVKYPIAQLSRCGTMVDSVVPGTEGVTVTQRLRIPVEDDKVPCSEPGTGLQTRTLTVEAVDGEFWPVQTAPVPAWGGICPQSLWLDSDSGVIDLYSAPSRDSTPAAVVGADGAMFPLNEAPLMQQRDGWNLVGFTSAVDGGPVKLQCGWRALD